MLNDLFGNGTSFQVSQDPNDWADYPTLGVSADGIYIGAFVLGPSNRTIWAIDKAPLITDPPSIGTITAWRNLTAATCQPAHTYGTPGAEYIIGTSTSSSLQIYRVDPPLTTPTLWDTGTVPVVGFNRPPPAPTLGGIDPLHTSGKLMMSVYRDGSLWTTHGIDVDSRAAVRWYEIDPVTRTVIQWGNVADPSLYFYYPSLMVNSAGHVAMGFSGSDANHFAGCYFTGRRASDGPGVMALPQLLKSGEAPYNPGGLFTRWGDYSYTTLDPVDEFTFWTVQEYARSSISYPNGAWGTWVAALGYDPCVLPGDCNDGRQCTVDDCLDGFCENRPLANATTCVGGLCCNGFCTSPTCTVDTDCDDANQCTNDTCINPNTCNAFCSNTWPVCVLGALDGCCGPTCTSVNDDDCHCGVGGCGAGEDQCNCPIDCGTPPANEVPNSTCHDGVDNDCDGYADCDDVLDCADDPLCFCDDNNGNSPLVCLEWSGAFPPVPDVHFGVDFTDAADPAVTLLTGNNSWKVWSQVSPTDDIPANLGQVRIDPTLPTESFSVAIAHGPTAGADNVASITLVDANWTGQSSLAAGSIAGDLAGEFVLQDSGGLGGVASFTIGGGLYGNTTIPNVDILQVNGEVSSNAMITLSNFVGDKHAEFNVDGGTFAGDLFLSEGLPLGAVIIVHGLLANTASVDLNGQELAGVLSFEGGSAEQSMINIGPVTGQINMFASAYSGSATIASIESGGAITMAAVNLTGNINVVGDWSGSLIFAFGSVAPGGSFSINGSLTNTGMLFFDQEPAGMAGDIVIGQDCDGQILVFEDMSGSIQAGGVIDGNIAVVGLFNGNICGSNLDPNQLLPSNINLTFGPGGTVCGEFPALGPAAQPAGEAGFDKNRFISFVPGATTARRAFRVTLATLPPEFQAFEGQILWVGQPVEYSESGGQGFDQPDPGGTDTFWSSQLTCDPYYMDWSSLSDVHVRGLEIVPAATYEIHAIVEGTDEAVESNYSVPLVIGTSGWADVAGPEGGPADLFVNLAIDLPPILNKWLGYSDALPKVRCDLLGAATQPSPILDGKITVNEILVEIDTFQGGEYPFTDTTGWGCS